MCKGCTVKVLIEDVFAGIASAEYEALYFDEEFNEALSHTLELGRKLLRLERSSERIVRHVCFEPAQAPDSPARQAFGSSRASFVEELDYDVRTRRGRWRTIPNLFRERVTNSGTLELADSPAGVRRIVRGEVKVSLFGFGRVIEKMIVTEIENSYARTTRFTNEWLARRER
jgi:hypothetical protein